MKIFKRLLTLILILIIILLLRHIYSTFKEENVSLGEFNLPFYSGTPDSVLNISSPSTSINISGIDGDSSSKVSVSKSNYYYKQLDSNSKIIYDKLESNIDNLKKNNYKLNFSTQFNTLLHESNGTKKLSESFQAAIDAFFYDHPELFYIDLTKMSLYTKSISFAGKTTYNISIIPENNGNYLSSQFSSASAAEQAEKKVQAIRNSFIKKTSGNDYSKIVQVHDTLVNMLEYDKTYSRPNTHNIYGALIEKKVVCEGYAKAFKYIMDGLNIPCILVGGTATNSNGKTESHMWNYVQINKKWYGVDPTWDDPIIVGGYTKNTIRHDYLCKGSVTFNQSHTISRNISENGKKFTYPTLSVYDYK